MICALFSCLSLARAPTLLVLGLGFVFVVFSAWAAHRRVFNRTVLHRHLFSTEYRSVHDVLISLLPPPLPHPEPFPPFIYLCRRMMGIDPDSAYASFDEIPEANVCDALTPEQCETIDPIEFAKHGETETEMDSGFFQKARELLGIVTP